MCGGPWEYMGPSHAVTRRPLLSCTTPLISLSFEPAPPPVFATSTTMSARAKTAVMVHGRVCLLKSRLVMFVKSSLHRCAGPRRRGSHRRRGHRACAGDAAPRTAADGVDVGFRLHLLAEKVVVVDIERDVRAQRPEDGIERRLPALVR